jgi:hypothetical protein
MSKFAPITVRAIKERLDTFQEIDEKKSAHISELTGCIKGVMRILVEALDKDDIDDDGMPIEDIARAVVNSLKKIDKEKSATISHLEGRIHTIRCTLTRSFPAGNPQCTPESSCENIALEFVNRFLRLETDNNSREIRKILKTAYGKDWVFSEETTNEELARAVVKRLAVKSGENEAVSKQLQSILGTLAAVGVPTECIGDAESECPKPRTLSERVKRLADDRKFLCKDRASLQEEVATLRKKNEFLEGELRRLQEDPLVRLSIREKQVLRIFHELMATIDEAQ